MRFSNCSWTKVPWRSSQKSTVAGTSHSINPICGSSWLSMMSTILSNRYFCDYFNKYCEDIPLKKQRVASKSALKRYKGCNLHQIVTLPSENVKLIIVNQLIEAKNLTLGKVSVRRDALFAFWCVSSPNENFFRRPGKWLGLGAIN